MKTTLNITLAIAIAALGAGCATLDRSRTLGNPAVPAVALAQQVCSNCHGLDGNSVSPNFPRLAAQQQAYTVSQLSGFRNHHRSDPAGFEYMWGLSRHLTDAQIQGIAAYFAAQAPAPNSPATAAASALGKDIFEHGIPAKEIPPCGSCHGAQAEGNGAFPRLAGQHSDYLVKQLLVFQRTDERPEGAVMKTVAHLLSRADMDQVAGYLQGLAPRR
jgi:cytochrome c553